MKNLNVLKRGVSRLIIKLFDIFFLLLVIVHACIVLIFDVKEFKKKNNEKLARKAKWISVSMIFISIVLFCFARIN
jgi:hypothetical protein